MKLLHHEPSHQSQRGIEGFSDGMNNSKPKSNLCVSAFANRLTQFAA